MSCEKAFRINRLFRSSLMPSEYRATCKEIWQSTKNIQRANKVYYRDEDREAKQGEFSDITESRDYANPKSAPVRETILNFSWL